MGAPSDSYRSSLALLTDLYPLTMAYGYWKSGAGDREAVFHLFFCRNPFAGGFSIACGLSYVVDYLNGLHFEVSDIAYVAGLRGNDGRPMFEPAFPDALQATPFSCDIDAIPEGTVVFPYALRVCGPIIQAQILETPLLNLINFQTLILVDLQNDFVPGGVVVESGSAVIYKRS